MRCSWRVAPPTDAVVADGLVAWLGGQPNVAASIKHLEEMARYCRGAVCRHKALVQHFGQRYDTPNCEACDLCLGNIQEVPEAQTVAKKILSCVARVKESFGIAHVIDVLRGANSESIRSRGHDQLTTYGLLKDAPKPDLRDWIYQLIGQDVLMQVGDDYPLLKLNAASWAVMGDKQKVRLIQLSQAEKRPRTGATSEAKPMPIGADPELFELLRSLRRQEASQAGVQPEMVFSDNVLMELARGRPTTEDALRRVSGVGDYRLQSFGKAFIEAITFHCSRKGLATDVPLPKTFSAPVAKGNSSIPSPKKLLAFKMYRGGESVEAVAKRTELTASTVTEYLAEFIAADKPASIFGWIPEDVCERVAAAVDMHGTGRLKPIFLELNEEVSYDHIRTVIAFLTSRQ